MESNIWLDAIIYEYNLPIFLLAMIISKFSHSSYGLIRTALASFANYIALFVIILYYK